MEGTGDSYMEQNKAGWGSEVGKQWQNGCLCLEVGTAEGKESARLVRLLLQKGWKISWWGAPWNPSPIHSSGNRHTWSWNIIWPFCFLSISKPPSVHRRKSPVPHLTTGSQHCLLFPLASYDFGFGNAVPKKPDLLKWSFLPLHLANPLISLAAHDPLLNFILN